MSSKMGFDEKEKGKKLNRKRSSSKVCRGWVIGDALIVLGRAVRMLGFEVEEVERFVRSPFGGMDEVPFVHYTTADGVDIPYGAYKLAGWGLVSPSFGGDDRNNPIPELTLTVTFENGADEKKFEELFTLLGQEMDKHASLFKGHAIRVTDPKDLVIPHTLDTTTPPNLFLDRDVMKEIEVSLLTPIRQAAELRAIGVKAQRGILLHGRYGTGKSLIAYLAAQESVMVGRTFVMCNMAMLSVAVQVSRFLQPSTLFIEDMDDLSTSYRALSSIRNLLSGVENKKGYDTITILTTNFLDKVIEADRSLLRPERVDAIIEIRPPSQGVVSRLIAFAGNGWLSEGDWDGVAQRMSETKTTPAVIIEIMNRAKIAALSTHEITPELVMHYFGAMSQQIALSDPVIPKVETTGDMLMKGIHDAVHGED